MEAPYSLMRSMFTTTFFTQENGGVLKRDLPTFAKTSSFVCGIARTSRQEKR